MNDRKVHDPLLDLVDKALGDVDLGADGDIGALVLHPHQPVSKQWIPQAVLAADRDDILAPDGHRDVVPRPLP